MTFINSALTLSVYWIGACLIQAASQGSRLGIFSDMVVFSNYAMVLQDTWIFEGTLRENLIYNKTDVPDARLDEVCEAAGLSGFVSRLPKGYDTVISDQTTLSAGQKQLITIARAMVKDAPLLILDEATSSVDTRTELKVQKAMDTLMAICVEMLPNASAIMSRLT